MQASPPVVARDSSARVDDVVPGRAGLENEQHVPGRDLEGDEARAVDQPPEGEQLAIEGRGSLEVGRVERRLQ